MHRAQPAYRTDEVTDTRPGVSEPHKVRKKIQTKKWFIVNLWKKLLWIRQELRGRHARRQGNRKASGGKRVDRRKEGEASRFSVTTYAISVCLRVRGVADLSVCWWRAAPAVGCRVGGGSGNDHVIGVRRVLHGVITRPVTKTSRRWRREPSDRPALNALHRPS